MERSISPDSILLLKIAQAAGVTTAWDRYEAQLPQCGFGETGLCCRHCLQGPCRIDPFGVSGPKLWHLRRFSGCYRSTWPGAQYRGGHLIPLSTRQAPGVYAA